MIRKIICIALTVALALTVPAWSFAQDEDSGVSEPENSVAAEPEDVEDAQSDPDEKDLEDEEEAIHKDAVLSVTVPSNLDFTIDPLETQERGQLFSDDFIIENYSDKDIVLTFENIRYTFANNSEAENDEDNAVFVSLKEPPTVPFGLKNRSKAKEIYMVLEYINCDLPDFVITDEEQPEPRSILLNAAAYDKDGDFAALSVGGSVAFRFSGIVNHLVGWENGDVTVTITYTLTDAVENFSPRQLVEPEDIENLETVSSDEPVSSEPDSAEPRAEIADTPQDLELPSKDEPQEEDQQQQNESQSEPEGS